MVNSAIQLTLSEIRSQITQLHNSICYTLPQTVGIKYWYESTVMKPIVISWPSHRTECPLHCRPSVCRPSVSHAWAYNLKIKKNPKKSWNVTSTTTTVEISIAVGLCVWPLLDVSWRRFSFQKTVRYEF